MWQWQRQCYEVLLPTILFMLLSCNDGNVLTKKRSARNKHTGFSSGIVCIVWWHLVSVRTFSVMYDHIRFLCSQNDSSDIRPHVKWAVGLVIADGHLTSFKGLCGYVWLTYYSLYHPWGYEFSCVSLNNVTGYHYSSMSLWKLNSNTQWKWLLNLLT